MASSGSSVAAAIVLAAGSGTRMKSATSKLLHTVAGRSLLSWAVEAAAGLEPERLVVVVGQNRDQVEAELNNIAPDAIHALQAEPRGTGDAVRAGLAALGQVDGDVVVTSSDTPLLTAATLQRLVVTHQAAANAITVLTSVVADPTGYGRIIRQDGEIVAIREHRDATAAEREIAEINASIYVFDAALLAEALGHLTTENDQGEFLLTDVVSYARQANRRVGGYVESDTWQTEGVNDRVQLAAIAAEMNHRILVRHMLAGVSVIDPATTWVDHGVAIEPDVVLWPGTILRGATSIATGAVIGPDTRLTDVEVGAGASVIRTEATLSVIGPKANVGPFSYLRPGTQLGESGKIGAFVETKNAQIGAGSKVPHLTYCGDAEIGAGVNIGAGTIFANYDGVHKFHSTVGDGAFVGSDSVLVAPVEVSQGAFVAAGSVITSDVEPGALAVARGRQRTIEGWVERKRQRDTQAAGETQE